MTQVTCEPRLVGVYTTRTPGLRESEEPVLLLVPGESGDRSGCLLLMGASLTEEGCKRTNWRRGVRDIAIMWSHQLMTPISLHTVRVVDTTICWAVVPSLMCEC